MIVSRKPAAILRVIPVDLPYPRAYDDVRLFEIEGALRREFLGFNAE